jgi:hypothetical protein
MNFESLIINVPTPGDTEDLSAHIFKEEGIYHYYILPASGIWKPGSESLLATITMALVDSEEIIKDLESVEIPQIKNIEIDPADPFKNF